MLEQFSVVITWQSMGRLFEGLGVTLQIALISVALSIILGTLFGIVLTVKKIKPIYFLSRIYLEAVRILPQLVLLFLAYFGLGRLGIDIDAITCSIVVFTLWGLAEFGDLLRAQLATVGQGQIDAGAALGMTKWQILRGVMAPQALRSLVSPAVNLISRMIKTTAIVPLIGVIEVLKVGQQIINFERFNAPQGSLWIYGAVLIMYFIVCWPISLAATKLEKWANGKQ